MTLVWGALSSSRTQQRQLLHSMKLACRPGTLNPLVPCVFPLSLERSAQSASLPASPAVLLLPGMPSFFPPVSSHLHCREAQPLTGGRCKRVKVMEMRGDLGRDLLEGRVCFPGRRGGSLPPTSGPGGLGLQCPSESSSQWPHHTCHS